MVPRTASRRRYADPQAPHVIGNGTAMSSPLSRDSITAVIRWIRSATSARAPGGKAGQDSPSVHRPPRRLVYFSDAVFAIAVTLLVLNIRPHADPGVMRGDKVGRDRSVRWHVGSANSRRRSPGPQMPDGRALPSLATALGVGACGMAVAISGGPSMDGHHAALNIPCDE
jgi:hypothetical protein